MGKEGYAAAQNFNWKWNSEFYKKEELEENSIYSLNHAQYIMTHANYFELQIINCWISVCTVVSMGSRLTSVFKATVGLLVKRGRDATAEKLKQGDITDQKLRDVIVRESFKPMENMKLRGTEQNK